MSASPNDIKHVLESMLGVFAGESREAYQSVSSHERVAKAVTSARKGDYEQFYFGLLYPFGQMIDGLLEDVTHSPEARFLLKNSRFVESHFQRLIEEREGATCSADKSRTIMRVLLRFYMTGEEIQFSYDQKFTYHLPKTVFTTHDDIVGYFMSLYSLYYGQPAAYIGILANILQKETGR